MDRDRAYSGGPSEEQDHIGFIHEDTRAILNPDFLSAESRLEFTLWEERPGVKDLELRKRRAPCLWPSTPCVADFS
jgi:hypothetical protein